MLAEDRKTPRFLTILYRGPLSSCNYDCSYCPFAKHHESAEELAVDRQCLERFVNWCAEQTQLRLSVFFTPWGEALHRRWYQAALSMLSHLPQIQKIAVQTNLATSLDWLAECDVSRIGLWCTFHPSQTTRAEFLKQSRQLEDLGVQHSVGMVGLREYFAEIKSMRNELPRETYLWINAFKDVPNYYQPEDVEWLEHVDPHFRTNTIDHPSLGKSCETGTKVISVDGQGEIRRCHFIKDVIGNIYDPEFIKSLQNSPCTRSKCECHIGYVHMPDLNLNELYGEGLLERVPTRFQRVT